jgi:hypothetical protein
MSRLGPGDFHALSTPLEVALTQLNVRETAPNRGPEVDEYLRSCGLEPSAGSYPWCVVFVRWCCSRVGIWLPRTASVKRLWEMGEDLRVDTPAPGDIAVHLRPDGLGHVGFFMRAFVRGPDLWYETVDGNTNAAGSREGDRVAIKERPNGYWNMGFLRPRRPQ